MTSSTSMTPPSTTDVAQKNNLQFDTYLIVAFICFILGAILVLMSLFRIVYYCIKLQRHENRRFTYVLRFTDSRPDVSYLYKDFYDSPALWY